jgi:hypothetical protein
MEQVDIQAAQKPIDIKQLKLSEEETLQLEKAVEDQTHFHGNKDKKV